MLAKTNAVRKLGDDFEKEEKQTNKQKNRVWMDREDTKLGKEDISGSGRNMRGYNLFWSSPGFKGRTLILSSLG